MILIIEDEIWDGKYVLKKIFFINLDYLIDSIFLPNNPDRFYEVRLK